MIKYFPLMLLVYGDVLTVTSWRVCSLNIKLIPVAEIALEFFITIQFC